MDAVSPFFIVRDVRRALEFYRDELGFEVTSTSGGADPFFAVVRRDGVRFLLKSVGVDAEPNRERHPDARWDAFVQVADPGALAAELSASLADTDDGCAGSNWSTGTGTCCSSAVRASGYPVRGRPR